MLGIVIGIIAGLLIIYGTIVGLMESHKSKLADDAARDLLSDFDFSKEKEEIRSVREEIKSIVDSYIDKYIPKENRCPHCNRSLVRRVGKYGPFLGCKNYPHCEYTRSL